MLRVAMEKETRKGPGRPRKFNEEEVLHAALELFWQHGVRGTATRDIEAATGVGLSSLHKIFGTKEQILHLALDRYEALIERELIGPMDRDLDGLGGIRTYFRHLVDFISKDGRCGCLIVNMMAETDAVSDELTKRIQDFRGYLRGVFRRALVRAVEHKKITGKALESRVELLMMSVLGLNSAARGGGPVSELRGMQAAVDVLIDSWRTAGCA
jgi:TetR/AcrR family transcriptional repressor of nem operon